MSILWVWLMWLCAFPLIEAYGLWKQDDKAQPLTYYLRRFMAYSWFFRLGTLLGICWLFAHLAFGVG